MVETKVPVTMSALCQRINRKLAPQEEVLKKTRGGAARAQFSDYYTLHWRSNHVRQSHVDPATLAQELGVLGAWETVHIEEE